MSVKILTETKGYEPICKVVVNDLYQPKLSTLSVKLKELFGRLNGSTKNMYIEYIHVAQQRADMAFDAELKNVGAEAAFNIHTESKIQEIRGDVYILTTIQCIAMKKQGENV